MFQASNSNEITLLFTINYLLLTTLILAQVHSLHVWTMTLLNNLFPWHFQFPCFLMDGEGMCRLHHLMEIFKVILHITFWIKSIFFLKESLWKPLISSGDSFLTRVVPFFPLVAHHAQWLCRNYEAIYITGSYNFFLELLLFLTYWHSRVILY